MQICIFEDKYYERLEPLIYSRPVYNLLCGFTSLREKISRAYPNSEIVYHVRKYLTDFMHEKFPSLKINQFEKSDSLFINGRLMAPENLSSLIPLEEKENCVYVSNGVIVAVRLSGKNLDEFKNLNTDVFELSTFSSLKQVEVKVKMVNYIWDIIDNVEEQFLIDFNELLKTKFAHSEEKILGNVQSGAHLIAKENIIIGKDALIKAGAVLDASNGPIVIGDAAVVASNAVIEGPVFIGEKSQVKPAARIFENAVIGKVCKVGGEVEHSIFMPYSNKQHAGFIGHAYIGSWVNLGADTNCSDLKNNYGSVKVYVNGEVVNSNTQFLGLVMGDHSKTAINSMFNTGSVVGFSCNIFGAGFPAKYIPSFSWGGSDAITTYDLARSLETAKRVLARRNKQMGPKEEKLFQHVFDITTNERRKRGYPY